VAWPFLGLCIFVVMFFRLEGSEGISAAELALFAVFAILGVRSLVALVGRRLHSRLIAPSLQAAIALAFYLLLSVLVARAHAISATAAGRDAVPILCLGASILAFTSIRSMLELRWACALLVGVMTASGLVWVNDLTGRSLGPIPLLVGGATPITPIAMVVWGGSVVIERRRVSWPWLGVALVGLLICILTNTRTIWVALGLTTLLMGMLVLGKERRVGTAVAVMLGICLAIVSALLIFYGGRGEADVRQSQEARFGTLAHPGEDLSVQIRMAQVYEGLRKFRESPLVGTGLGYQYTSYLEFDRYQSTSNINHSDLVNSLAKLGLVGTCLLYLVLYRLMRASLDLYHHGATADLRALGLLGASAIIIAAVMGNSTPLLQIRQSAFSLGLLSGLILAGLELSSRLRDQHEEALAGDPPAASTKRGSPEPAHGTERRVASHPATLRQGAGGAARAASPVVRGHP
jgi:O-antigen ligase